MSIYYYLKIHSFNSKTGFCAINNEWLELAGCEGRGGSLNVSEKCENTGSASIDTSHVVCGAWDKCEAAAGNAKLRIRELVYSQELVPLYAQI